MYYSTSATFLVGSAPGVGREVNKHLRKKEIEKAGVNVAKLLPLLLMIPTIKSNLFSII
jgi:hypothetical protein